MTRTCDACGDAYEAQRPTAKYCTGKCRKRAQRGVVTIPGVTKRENPPVTEGDSTPVEPPSLVPDLEPGPVESALLTELIAVERDASTLGQAALALARRVDIGRDTGAGLASLVKQLEATRRAATADVKSAASPLDQARDEVAERRARRGA